MMVYKMCPAENLAARHTCPGKTKPVFRLQDLNTGFVFSGGFCAYAENEVPHPQVEEAFGLLKVNPRF